jgi:hypothetical protein
VEPRALQSIALAVTEARSVQLVLERIVEGLAGQPGIALARIWLIAPGDICSTCVMRTECPDQSRCLHLAASAGRSRRDSADDWGRLTGDFRRMPLNVRKVGRILVLGDIVGESPVLHAVLGQVARVAPTNASVLLLGESGTGKELVASAIHDRSSRRHRAFVRVNCASVHADLFESEFFGHIKGAFTGAVRDRVGRFQPSCLRFASARETSHYWPRTSCGWRAGG